MGGAVARRRSTRLVELRNDGVGAGGGDAWTEGA